MERLAPRQPAVFILLVLSFFLSCQPSGPCDCDSANSKLKNELIRESIGNLSENESTEEAINWIVENSVDRDLDDIQKEGVLRALMIYSSTSYFIYRGEPMGFEYELLKQLAEQLDVQLELVLTSNLDDEFAVLNRGDVDIIAHGMTVTNERKWEVDFTEYLYLTRQVLVQRMPEGYLSMKYGDLQRQLIHDPIELIDDTVSIRRNSAASERVRSLSNEIGGTVFVDTLESHLTDDQIIRQVKDGRIRYTISDENIARINAAYYPVLKVDVPVSFSQRIAWVTRKKSPLLRKKVNEWIISERKKTNYNVTYNKYFRNARNFIARAKKDFYNLEKRQISEYDGLIRKYAQPLGWDWRLLASQMFQESKFDPRAKSWAGAVGLMQVMPATAKSYGIKNLYNSEQNIRGGIKYLRWLAGKITDAEDSLTHKQFVLASYNCGLGHLLDARALARKRGLDPTKWSGNVEAMLLELSEPQNFNMPFIKHGYVRGEEPVNYVKEILERYDLYKKYIPKS